LGIGTISLLKHRDICGPRTIDDVDRESSGFAVL